jgi:hypothetical protein
MDYSQDSTDLDQTVTLYFSNGSVLKFEETRRVIETEDTISFVIGDIKYMFKKASLAGWSLPLLSKG